MYEIVHVSDLHFGNDARPFSLKYLADLVSDLILSRVNVNNVILAISGDVSFRGACSVYEDASIFVNMIIDKTSIHRNMVIGCPGNHDIIIGDDLPFSSFSSFMYSLRRDSKYDYTKSNYVFHSLDDVLIVSINTSYHYDHKYGLVDQKLFEYIQRDASEINKYKYKVCMMHHHLINVYENDISTTRNSFQLLSFLDNLGFDLILHGHQHSKQYLTVGESKLLICSGRSLNFQEKGYLNGINVYSLFDNNFTVSEYIISYDNNPVRASATLFNKIVR